MGQIDIKTGKHEQYAHYAHSSSLAAAQRSVIEQAWERMEAWAVAEACKELCSARGRINNYEEFLESLKKRGFDKMLEFSIKG